LHRRGVCPRGCAARPNCRDAALAAVAGARNVPQAGARGEL